MLHFRWLLDGVHFTKICRKKRKTAKNKKNNKKRRKKKQVDYFTVERFGKRMFDMRGECIITTGGCLLGEQIDLRTPVCRIQNRNSVQMTNFCSRPASNGTLFSVHHYKLRTTTPNCIICEWKLKMMAPQKS